MKLRQKIIVLAIAPLIVALIGIAFAVQFQANLLAQQQRATVEAAYLASKEAELEHYVTLATRSIDHLYQSGRNDQATKEAAMAILATLEYGDDGYFFLYDLKGKNLMHPRQPELVGRDLWELRDTEGSPTIQRLTERAIDGGGHVRYLWEKPSSQQVAPKLGYVVALKRWDWMLGTGLYLDDIDATLARIDNQISGNIRDTMFWITGIAIASVMVIALFGLVLNVSEQRVADAKLRVLTQSVVRSQEQERARLSRDLHDGISQWLVSIKLQVESGVAKLMGNSGQPEFAKSSLDRAACQLNDVLGEVRRIAQDLRPALLDDLGLAAALDRLVREFSEHTAVDVKFMSHGKTDGLSEAANTVLFRIAQESLTNIQRHANATSASMHLLVDRKTIKLVITDNGGGFDVDDVAHHPKRGIGLRNMHERLHAVGGELQLASSREGTQVTASLPRI